MSCAKAGVVQYNNSPKYKARRGNSINLVSNTINIRKLQELTFS